MFKRKPANDALSQFTFSKDGENATVKGNALLAPYTEGRNCGCGIFSFYGEGDDKTWILVNTRTGKIRKIRDTNGEPLLGKADIDADSIRKGLRHTACLDSRDTRYGFSFYCHFCDGFSALCWTLYPDGRYFADEDGYGMEDNDEENAYCIIDTNLDIVAPFQPMRDVTATLARWRTGASFAEDTRKP